MIAPGGTIAMSQRSSALMVETSATNEQKAAVWRAYRAGTPMRVPVLLGCNPRIWLLDPELNTQGITFEQAANDPRTHVEIALRFQLHMHMTLHRFTDDATGLPDRWTASLWTYNVYEAASFGAPVEYPPGQVPATEPIYDDANKQAVFDVPIDKPLALPFIADRLEFWREMQKVCNGMTFKGRPVTLAPWAATGSDGPFTVGCNLRGSALLLDMIDDPDYFDQLMAFITQATIHRRDAMHAYWGDRIERANGLADDSIAMIGTDTYTERILAHHRAHYDAGPKHVPRTMHLCGDATRLFPTIARELNVVSFDTGFPVDHGALRDALGEDIEILGGPPIDLLLHGSPDDVYTRTRSILQSGVMRGGRFILREANNLPPRCPLKNLEAMYAACLAFGRYDCA
jgi:uroporphyrinogen-III decarboxylase